MFTALRVKLLEVFRSEGFQKYFKNTSWLLGERVLSMGVAFLIGVLVARHLGPEKMGIIAYALGITGFLDVLIIMGMEGPLTRNLVQEPEKTPTILGSAMGIRFAGSAVAILILIGIMLFTPSDRELNLVLVIMMISKLLRGGQIFYNLFESRVITFFDARIKLVTLVLSSLFRLALIYLFAAGVVWFAWAYVVIEGTILIGQVIVYYRKDLGRLRDWRFDMSYARGLLRDSWPLIFSSVLAMLYMQIDQIMIKHMLDEAQTGIYWTAVKFSTIFVFVPLLLNSSVSPAVYEAKKQSKELYYKRLSQLMTMVTVISLLIILGTTLTGQWLIDNTYGKEFSPAGGVLIVHVWSLLFVAIGNVSTTYLLAEKLEKLRLYRTALGAVLNVGMNLWAIPRYGIMGAAYATLVSQAAASYLTYIFSKRTHDIFWIQTRSLLLLDLVKVIREYRNKAS